MRNRLLDITSRVIAYVKELRPHTGSIAGCILMQQLDHWFASKDGESFYKFLEPCSSKYYNDGDSWTEELAITTDEFRSAFDKIGVRYTSKTAFKAAADPFQGKFYCSYFDKKEGTTHYFRNHAAVDTLLDSLLQKGQSTVDGNSNLQKSSTPIPVDGNSNPYRLGKSIPPISTEKTTKKTQKQQQQSIVEAAPVVDDSKESPETEALAQCLNKAGYTPLTAARVAARQSPEAAAAWLDYVKNKKLANAGGFLRKNIASGEMPDGYAAPVAPQPPTASELAARETRRLKHEAAANRVLESFPTAYRKSIEKDKRSLLDFVTQIHPNELAAELRK